MIKDQIARLACVDSARLTPGLMVCTSAGEIHKTIQDVLDEERAALMAWLRAWTCRDNISVLDCPGHGCACMIYQSVAEMIRGRGTETKEAG